MRCSNLGFATIGKQFDARNEAGIMGSKKRRGTRDLIRFGNAPQR
jgi:hypothetical protein